MFTMAENWKKLKVIRARSTTCTLKVTKNYTNFAQRLTVIIISPYRAEVLGRTLFPLLGIKRIILKHSVLQMIGY